MNIGKQIKRLRTEKNIIQDVLADYLGVSAQAVSKWENGVTSPDIGLLPEISVFFGVKIDELFALPVASHFERIEKMFTFEREISDENFKYSEKFLTEMIDSNKKNARAYGDLAHLYNHRTASLQEVASQYVMIALGIEPEVKSHHVALWNAKSAVCGDGYYDNHFEVIEYYKGFIIKNPNNRRAIITLIENLFADNRHREARCYVDQLATIKIDYLYEMYLGDIALAEGNLEKALRLWDEGVEKYSTTWQAYACRGDRLRMMGILDQAILDFDKCMAIQETPRMTDGLLALAQIYEEMKAYDKAINVREQQIQILKEDFDIISGETIDKPKREIERLIKLSV